MGDIRVLLQAGGVGEGLKEFQRSRGFPDLPEGEKCDKLILIGPWSSDFIIYKNSINSGWLSIIRTTRPRLHRVNNSWMLENHKHRINESEFVFWREVKNIFTSFQNSMRALQHPSFTTERTYRELIIALGCLSTITTGILIRTLNIFRNLQYWHDCTH